MKINIAITIVSKVMPLEKCMRLKNYIQDLIDKGDIEIATKNTNANDKLKMYQDPFPKYRKDKGLPSHRVSYDYTNNIKGFDSLIGRIEPPEHIVNTITI